MIRERGFHNDKVLIHENGEWVGGCFSLCVDNFGDNLNPNNQSMRLKKYIAYLKSQLP
jgi:hypothetical protein